MDLSFDPSSGVNGTVNAVAVQPDGKVFIGGEFTAINGVVRPYVARLLGDARHAFTPAKHHEVGWLGDSLLVGDRTRL